MTCGREALNVKREADLFLHARLARFARNARLVRSFIFSSRACRAHNESRVSVHGPVG
jgi:hypothetical protein